MEDVAIQLGIDIDRRTTRGRACPRCGGKIIPSRRAVYQSTGDPNAVFPSWQCERCGYEELVSDRPRPPQSTARKPQKTRPLPRKRPHRESSLPGLTRHR